MEATGSASSAAGAASALGQRRTRSLRSPAAFGKVARQHAALIQVCESAGAKRSTIATEFMGALRCLARP
eukprot:5108803-Alexandrium_andersonii.AAC.1